MTEAEWLASTEVRKLLFYLRGSGRASDRRLRLFAVSCCRRLWHLLADDPIRRAILVVERHTDEQADDRELAEARQAAMAAQGRWPPWPTMAQMNAGTAAVACTAGPFAAAKQASWDVEGALRAEAVTDLLHGLFANAFRPVALDPTWRTAEVMALATAAYEERILPAGTLDRDRLAVLADALEDAGCDNADILAHLRGPGPHVRGCWVLDLLLGKQ